MDRPTLLARLRAHRHVVQASVSSSGAPQAAVVGVAVGDDLTLVFDTVGSSRKAENLRRDPRIAFTFAADDGSWTIQYEGVADEPAGDELERVRALYFATFPDGRDRLSWPGITHFRVRPSWIRHTSYEGPEPALVVLTGDALRS